MSYKIALIICTVILGFIGVRFHIDPAGITASEFPYAEGEAFDIAVTIRHLLGSLLLFLTSITVFAINVKDTKSQQLLLNGYVIGFAIMCVTLGTMTFTEAGELRGGSIMFAVLTALCVYTRLQIKSSEMDEAEANTNDDP